MKEDIKDDPRYVAARTRRRLQETDHPPPKEHHVVEGKPVLLLNLLRNGQKGFNPRMGPQFLVRFPDGTERAVKVSDIKIAGQGEKLVGITNPEVT